MGASPAPEHTFCGGHAMKIADIDLMLGKIRDSSGVDEFVVIGSLSALGLVADGLPPRTATAALRRQGEISGPQ